MRRSSMMPATAPHIRQCSSSRTLGRRPDGKGPDEDVFARMPGQLIQASPHSQGVFTQQQSQIVSALTLLRDTDTEDLLFHP